MKYSLIILIILTMLINQMLSRNLKGGENDNIQWTRLKGNFLKWRFEFLNVLDSPAEVEDVIIYLKLNEEKKQINLYLLLTPEQAETLGLNMGLTRILPNVMLYEAEFDMFHVNSLLTMFFWSDLHAEFLYSLSDDTRYLGSLEGEDVKWKPAVERFKNLKGEENINNILNFKDVNTNFTLVRIQKLISQVRNKKI
jgi:hypothetical protein